MPFTHTTKETLPPHATEAVDWTGSHPRMPPGYVSDDPWGPVEEARLVSTEPRSVPPETWVTDCILKWSSLEKLGRGEQAKRLSAQVSDAYTWVAMLFKSTGVSGFGTDCVLQHSELCSGSPVQCDLCYMHFVQRFRVGSMGTDISAH